METAQKGAGDLPQTVDQARPAPSGVLLMTGIHLLPPLFYAVVVSGVYVAAIFDWDFVAFVFAFVYWLSFIALSLILAAIEHSHRAKTASRRWRLTTHLVLPKWFLYCYILWGVSLEIMRRLPTPG